LLCAQQGSLLQASFKYFLLQDIAMVLVFSIGYAGIIFEESLAFNKSGVALLMAVCLWVIRSIGVSYSLKSTQDFSDYFQNLICEPYILKLSF